MAARKRGLGKSLADIIADATAADEAAGSTIVPRKGEPLSKTRGGLNALISTGEDFGPYFLDQADTYYQGPSRSTRVAAHQFIPLEELPEERTPLNREQFKDHNIMGYIYVRFFKKNTLWQYGPVSLQQYRVFRESASKGRSVTALESIAGHGPGSEKTPGLEI